LVSLSGLPKLQQLPSLDFEQPAFDRRCAPQAP